MKLKLLHTLQLSLLSFMILGISSSQNTSYAVSVIADTPCDSLYYESLSARAWLEAQREITQNQNIILKPDSVFQYTCFDLLIDELAAHGTNMLSESTRYGAGTLNPNGLDDALTEVVGKSLYDYILNNFDHNLLGGHIAGAGIVSKPDDAKIDGGSYTCDMMERVWQAAKCMNFISTPATDGFFTFAEYASDIADKRNIPQACTPIPANWVGNLTIALTSGPWTNDPVQTYFEQTEPQSCTGSTCECSGNPIPTGVTVIRNEADPKTYEEHICLQPGCRYNPDGGDLSSSLTGVAEGCYGR